MATAIAAATSTFVKSQLSLQVLKRLLSLLVTSSFTLFFFLFTKDC